jgi:hypothetical protein
MRGSKSDKQWARKMCGPVQAKDELHNVDTSKFILCSELKRVEAKGCLNTFGVHAEDSLQLLGCPELGPLFF